MDQSDYFKSILSYDENTGKLYWKHRADMPAFWNTRYAGKEAGRINNGYVSVKINDKSYLAHRIIWCIKTGKMPANLIDHINMDRKDNTFENLREASYSTNMMNMGKPLDNTSGFKGVNFNHVKKKWMARICVNGERQHLGYFDCIAAAYFAYVVAANKYHGAFARVA